MTTCTRACALLFLQRSTFLNTVNLIIIGCNGIRNQMFLDTCIVQARDTENGLTFKEVVNRQRLMQSELRTLNGLTSRIFGCLKINSMFCSTVLYFLTSHVFANVVRVIESEII